MSRNYNITQRAHSVAQITAVNCRHPQGKPKQLLDAGTDGRRPDLNNRVFFRLPIDAYKAAVAAELSPCSGLTVNPVTLPLWLVFIFHLWRGITLNGLDSPRENANHNTDMSQPVERCKPEAYQVTDTHLGGVCFGILDR